MKAASSLVCAALFVGCADTAAEPALRPAEARSDAGAVDAATADACVTYTFFEDGDGDGHGAGERRTCVQGHDAPAGLSNLDGDCDDADPARSPRSPERFADGVDSDCDELDDVAVASLPCSCHFLSDGGAPEVETACAQGFEPAEGNRAIATASLDAQGCEALPDLSFAFVAQCNSECYAGPIYLSVANLGGQPSRAAVATLGRAPPVSIEPLQPGERTSWIAVEESRELQLSIAMEGDECSKQNNALRLLVSDYHCGFF